MGRGRLGAAPDLYEASEPVPLFLTPPVSSVVARLGPVLAGPGTLCVGAAGRSAAVCGVGGWGGGGGGGWGVNYTHTL